MTQHEWKPGDVALIEVGCHANRRVAIRTGIPSNMGWAYSDIHDGKSTNTWSADGHPTVSVVRRLVVIDPEDREQVERLLGGYHAQHSVPFSSDVDAVRADRMQDALREFANPKPPTPEEPMGLGAVVEDSNGTTWVRVQTDDAAPWMRSDAARDGIERPYRYYAGIDAVRILSAGVTS